MAANLPFVSPLLLLQENPEAVLAALRQGWVDHLSLAGDQVTDEHVGYALRRGLLAECAAAFPDPRCEPEIPIVVLLTASVAGAFQGEYALSQAGCALHSPVLLAELGLNAAWLQPGEDLSRRGTQTEALFHGDGLRKLLLQIAAADREAGRLPGESLLDWWNQSVGPAFLRLVGGGTGAWIRDVTKLIVNLKNDHYEGSEVATQQKPARPGEKAPPPEPPQRGYKLGLLSTLLSTGRLLVEVAWAGLRPADLSVCAAFVAADTPMAAGGRRPPPGGPGLGRWGGDHAAQAGSLGRCHVPPEEQHGSVSHRPGAGRGAAAPLETASDPPEAGDPEGQRHRGGLGHL